MRAAVEEEEDMEADLRITGMQCEGCVANVTDALKVRLMLACALHVTPARH